MSLVADHPSTAQLHVKVAINLDEDGINLWLAALRNSTALQSTSTSNLLQLFPLAMALLAGNLDLLGKITFIVESYFFVDALLVLQVCWWNILVSCHRQPLQNFSLDLMNAVVSVMRGRALQTNQRGVLNCVNFMMQLAPSSLWGEPVHRSGFFNHIVKILEDDEVGIRFCVQSCSIQPCHRAPPPC